MKKLFSIFVLISSLNLFAKETKRVTVFSEKNEPLTIVNYKKEKDDLIKRELYGNKPVYDRSIDYFEANNKEKVDRIERFRVYDERKNPIKCELEKKYYKSDRDDGLKLIEIQYASGDYEIKNFIYTENKDRITHKRQIILNNTLISEETSFLNRIDGLKKSFTVFENGSIYSTENIYEENITKFKHEILYYSNNTLKLQYVECYENPEGIISILINKQEKENAQQIVYDSRKSLHGITECITVFDANDKRKKEQLIFGDKLYKGEIFLLEKVYDNTGENVVSIQGVNKDLKQIYSGK